ncbi:MAG: hypothetical protein RLZZ515_2614 [Cyanobacteriota bacterium]|jgi:hypothetical protein
MTTPTTPTRYGLSRAGRWLSPITRKGVQLAPIERAWTAPTVDEAIDQLFILRACFGMSAEVRAVRPTRSDDNE